MEPCAIRQFGLSYQLSITQEIRRETDLELMNKPLNISGKNGSPQVLDQMFSKPDVSGRN